MSSCRHGFDNTIDYKSLSELEIMPFRGDCDGKFVPYMTLNRMITVITRQQEEVGALVTRVKALETQWKRKSTTGDRSLRLRHRRRCVS